jgi:hypothetical protein
LAIAVLLALASSARAEVEFVRLWTGYKETSAFLRLREFITGKESFGNTIILRTDPDERTGLYYTVRLADRERGSLPPGEVHLQVVPPDGVEPVDFRFPFAGTDDRQTRFEIGLTGNDWPHGRTLPLAWKLEFLDAQGKTLASRQSFLWSDNARESASQ